METINNKSLPNFDFFLFLKILTAVSRAWKITNYQSLTLLNWFVYFCQFSCFHFRSKSNWHLAIEGAGGKEGNWIKENLHPVSSSCTHLSEALIIGIRGVRKSKARKWCLPTSDGDVPSDTWANTDLSPQKKQCLLAIACNWIAITAMQSLLGACTIGCLSFLASAVSLSNVDCNEQSHVQRGEGSSPSWCRHYTSWGQRRWKSKSIAHYHYFNSISQFLWLHSSTGQTASLYHFCTCTTAGRSGLISSSILFLSAWVFLSQAYRTLPRHGRAHFTFAAYVWLFCILLEYVHIVHYSSFFFNLHPHECYPHFFLPIAKWKVCPRQDDLAHFHGSSIECRWRVSVTIYVRVLENASNDAVDWRRKIKCKI